MQKIRVNLLLVCAELFNLIDIHFFLLRLRLFKSSFHVAGINFWDLVAT